MIAKTNDLGLTQAKVTVRVDKAKYSVESLVKFRRIYDRLL